jgi:predicted  nucleic acid-binding Zn-ribbon protein
MSIRALARDLYRAQQEVSKLEKELEEASHDKRDVVQDELRQVRAELNTLKKMLDGEKESSSFRKKFQGFGQ